jgi:hypothetical protein
MHFSSPSLHPRVISVPEHLTTAEAKVRSVLTQRTITGARTPATLDSVAIPLTTVSASGTFDAYIAIRFRDSSEDISLVMDTGNSMLVVPYWESIAAINGWQNNYTILGQTSEPWGCPANVVRGPIDIATATGDLYTLPNCIFYACTANNSGNARTANFGAGCLKPWSASAWNTPSGIAVTMQSPLTYNSSYPYAEMTYAAAPQVLTAAAEPKVASGSSLTLYKSQPPRYQLLDILADMEWMSLRPMALSVGGSRTPWPTALPAIAMIDSGGGPVFLSDPGSVVCNAPWPDQVQNPSWTSGSVNCQSVADAITIELGDGQGSVTYTIDPNSLPPSVQGLSLVMCQNCQYMRGQNGMNIGGISLLVNDLLIDYANCRVGLAPK